MRRIYISGPMTGLPDENVPAFNAEAERLRALGFEVVNPPEIGPLPIMPRDRSDMTATNRWKAFLRADLRELMTCDTLAYLPGWEDSDGAHLELYVAKRVGIGVIEARKVTWLCGSLD